MTALLCYGIDLNTNAPLFAAVADETQARYVWPALGEPFLPDDRPARLAQDTNSSPGTPGEWLSLATYNLGYGIQVTDPVTVPDLGEAIGEARSTMNEGRAVMGAQLSDPQTLNRVREAFDQTSEDYPGFGEDEGAETPEAMNNFVLQMLGGVDPDGPNGWILQAMEDPQSGANGYVHLPGYSYDYDASPPEGEVEALPEEDLE